MLTPKERELTSFYTFWDIQEGGELALLRAKGAIAEDA